MQHSNGVTILPKGVMQHCSGVILHPKSVMGPSTGVTLNPKGVIEHSNGAANQHPRGAQTSTSQWTPIKVLPKHHIFNSVGEMIDIYLMLLTGKEKLLVLEEDAKNCVHYYKERQDIITTKLKKVTTVPFEVGNVPSFVSTQCLF